MTIQKNHPMGDKFTWQVEVTSKYFARVETEQDMKDLVTSQEYKSTPKKYILGGGANTLFASSFYDGLVIEMATQGYKKEQEDERHEYWRAQSGVDWVDFVEKMVIKHGLGGLENLAYIPGRVGSAPIQNIAAYGATFEDVCEGVELFDFNTSTLLNLSARECEFGYRDSIFKKRLKNGDKSFVIWSVLFKLTKPGYHLLESGYFSNYESLQSELTHLQGAKPTIQDIYRAVVSIRKKKLPEVTDCGTNGSVFVNPIVTGEELEKIISRFPNLQYYPAEKMKYVTKDELRITSDKKYKIAAGHVFDELGWKGKRVGSVGTWKNHALVLCNFGATDPADIIRVIEMMQDDFERATGIRLEPEINVVR